MITVASLSGTVLLHVHEDVEDDARYPMVRDLIGHISSGTFGIRPAPQQVSLIKNDDTRPLEHHEFIPGGTTVTYVIANFKPHDRQEAERLISASLRGLVTIVAGMLERLVDPNITANGCTGLHMALDRQALLGDIQLRELVTLFMDSHGDPNLLARHGASPLSLAHPTSWWVSREEHRNSWWAGLETALHFASGRGHLHTVHLLITFKAQLELLDGRGQNWLQVATGSVETLRQAFLATTSRQTPSGRCPRACDICHARRCKKLPGHYHICLTCLRTQSGDPDLSLPLIWKSSVARCSYKCLDCYDRGCISNCALRSDHDCTTCICATCAADHPSSMVEAE
eukprot:Skav220646  [mRNA]  locus=scaffold112:752036:753061:- [translate_table: standard]